MSKLSHNEKMRKKSDLKKIIDARPNYHCIRCICHKQYFADVYLKKKVNN